jgi:hypothetical protein
MRAFMVSRWKAAATIAFAAPAVGAAMLAPVLTRSAYAGKLCGATVQSGEASGKTEAEARAAATVWWSSRAGLLGKGYEAWDESKDKSVNCRRGPFGTFKCTASAKPCLREGLLPDDGHKQDL